MLLTSERAIYFTNDSSRLSASIVRFFPWLYRGSIEVLSIGAALTGKARRQDDQTFVSETNLFETPPRQAKVQVISRFQRGRKPEVFETFLLGPSSQRLRHFGKRCTHTHTPCSNRRFNQTRRGLAILAAGRHQGVGRCMLTPADGDGPCSAPLPSVSAPSRNRTVS